MNCNQNERINQVNEQTLVVGVDIAKDIHYARTFNSRGIEYAKAFKFCSDANGFNEFFTRISKIANANNKTEIIVGIEPTGHYWYTFAKALKESGILLVQVNPYHVKKAKELDDGTPSKSDIKDPKTIAMLVKDGRYQLPYLPEGIYAELRKAYDIREVLIKKRISTKNRIQRWLVIYFPEFTKVFKSWEGKTAIMTLRQFPLPEMLVVLTEEQIVGQWKKSIKRAVGNKRAKNLIDAAKTSTGMTEGLEMAVYELNTELDAYIGCNQKLEELETIIERICKDIPGVKNVMSIKGVGMMTAAGFFAEVGDIRRFDSPKQIIKLAGLNIVINGSGKHKGKSTISKRGRSRLRAVLFRAIIPMIAINEAFNQLHIYNIKIKEKPMKKMQSVTALCSKLIRLIYRLVTNDERYNPEKMLKDIHRNGDKKIAA